MGLQAPEGQPDVKKVAIWQNSRAEANESVTDPISAAKSSESPKVSWKPFGFNP
jgi:hypothetical protein